MVRNWQQHFIKIAVDVASMGTCARRNVGCVLVDDRNFILSTGMNGVPPKWPHCKSFDSDPGFPCLGSNSPPGTDLDRCVAAHAEINALLHCADIRRIRTVYCTTSPCINCVKALLVTWAVDIVFLQEYPHPEARELWVRHSRDLWPASPRRWIHVIDLERMLLRTWSSSVSTDIPDVVG